MNKVKMPRYQQIAVDIAGKIVMGTYEVGEKIFARSTIALQYGVSAETARRAIALLDDLGIIDVAKASGCTIASKEKAERFRNRMKAFETVDSLQEKLQKQLDEQHQMHLKMKHTIKQLGEQFEHYQHSNPLQPMKISITDRCLYKGKTVGEMNLWQHTGATLVAIYRDGVMQVSPGPYAILKDGDELYFIGAEDCWKRLEEFLYKDDV